METPAITWNQAQARTAAEEASNLSALLQRHGFFKQKALCWLTPDHLAKFLDVLDAAEARRLRRYAEDWHYESDPSATTGCPLLDALWKLSVEAGQRLVARIAAFELQWVSRWWKWRCDARTGQNLIDVRTDRGDDTLARLFIDVLTQMHLEVPSRHGLPTDAGVIIDAVLDFGEKSDQLALLDILVTSWGGSTGSDPVTRAMRKGHGGLEAALRSRWCAVGQPSGKRRDDDLWVSWPEWGGVGPAIARAACAAPDRFRLELGFTIGRRMGEGREPSREDTAENLKKLDIEPTTTLVDAVHPMVELWTALRTLAKYEKDSWQHKTELVGLRARVAALAAASPDLWAQALPWILVRASAFGDVAQAVTLELATTAPEVRRALEIACSYEVESVRVMGRGLCTLLDGLEEPTSGLARTLADAAAHYMDGSPIFPHPLAPVSATWLGSTGVERAIANGVRRACDRFAVEVRDQGGDVEEALTKALVKEIEVQFRDVQPRVKALGATGSKSPAPVLSVSQRPASKTSEEPVYGCDIAWLLNATVRGRYSATWVDLVQVKKTVALQQRRDKKPRADSWTIDVKQLRDIVKWSATAAYWLVASAGEVLVVPARHLDAIRRGTKKDTPAATFAVGYHEVRSVAIPVEQYIVDLLIGQWVGTSADDVVRFARGDDSSIRPRAVIEVTISIGGQDTR